MSCDMNVDAKVDASLSVLFTIAFAAYTPLPSWIRVQVSFSHLLSCSSLSLMPTQSQFRFCFVPFSSLFTIHADN